MVGSSFMKISRGVCNSMTAPCQSVLMGFLGYDKLALKQTMLKHEAIFKTQVFELHRLYGRQREMMDELKRQAQCSYALEARTSQSSATSPNLLQVDASNIWERSSGISTSINRPSILCVDEPPHSFDGMNGTEIQISSVSKASNGLKNDERLSGQIVRAPKISFDLQLPADAYIEVEDTRQDDTEDGGRSLFQPRNISPNGDVDFVHESSCNIGYLGDKEFQNSDLGLRHGSGSLNIADLNEPVKDVCFEEACTSASSMLPRKESLYARSQENPLVLETCSSSRNIYNTFSQGLQNEGRVIAIFQDTGREQKRLRLPLSKGESGHRDCNRRASVQNIFSETPGDSSEFGQFIPIQTEDLSSSYLSNQNLPEELFIERTICHNNLSSRNQTPGKICHTTTSAQMSGSLSFPADFEHVPRTSSLNFPWEKPVCSIDMPINVEEFTSLRRTRTGKTKSSGLDPSVWMPAYLPHERFDSETIYHSTGHHDKLQSGSNFSSDVNLPKMSFDKLNLITANNDTNLFDVLNAQNCSTKIGKDFNLNQALPNGFSEKPGHKVPEVNTPSPEIPRLGGNSCTREFFDLNKAVETEIVSEISSKVIGTEAMLPQESHRNKVVGAGMFMDPMQSKNQKEIPENPRRKKALEVSIVDTVHDAEYKMHSNGFATKARSLDLEKPISEDEGLNDDDTGHSNGIDLNFVAASINHLESSGNASDAEVQVLLKPSVSNVTRRCTIIDLELPPEALTQLMLAEDTHAHDQSMPKPILNQKNDLISSEISPATAAEVIISMSSKTSGCIQRSNPLPNSPESVDLLWFAGVVTSHMGLVSDFALSSSVCGGENSASSDVDGMDFFEAMTLRLIESKVEDFLVRAPKKENYEENDGKFSSLLLSKPRRGQARRRRQKRDFQKDVLPGLALLSRQEVMEDIQMIGDMMRASGHDWQSSKTRRNSGRGGGRGRRQPNRRATATVMVEVPAELPPNDSNFVELEIEGMSIVGWGSTRRCRRPRCHPGNITPQALS